MLFGSLKKERKDQKSALAKNMSLLKARLLLDILFLTDHNKSNYQTNQNVKMYVLFYMAFRIIISQERVNSLSSNNYFAISSG